MLQRVMVSAAITLTLSIAALAQTEPGASQVLDELWTSKTAIQVLAGSAVITAVINAIWFLVSALLHRLQHWWNATSTVYPVAFTRGMTKARYDQIKPHIKGFSCLHVRYGTDQYLSTLASDQEKFEGRLKNNVLPIKLRFDNQGNALFSLSLPLHKRIGTQFKCFVTVAREEALASVQQFLADCDRIKDISVSKSIRSNRIYFLLDRFDEVKTVDGHTNNMVYPE
jgi:hypothetical protein